MDWCAVKLSLRIEYEGVQKAKNQVGVENMILGSMCRWDIDCERVSICKEGVGSREKQYVLEK